LDETVDAIGVTGNWMAWQATQPSEPSNTPTLRGVSAYVAHLLDRSEWVAYDALKALKAWSRFLEWEGSVDVSPLKGMPNRDQPETMRTPVAELGEIEKLLDTCSGDSLEDSRDRAVICMLRCAGMRRGELIALTWDDIDFTDNTDSFATRRSRTVGVVSLPSMLRLEGR